MFPSDVSQLYCNGFLQDFQSASKTIYFHPSSIAHIVFYSFLASGIDNDYGQVSFAYDHMV
jgi:hypothetical protein